MFSETEEDRDWRLYAGDMIEFAEKVLAYTSEIDQAAFVADSLTYDATLRNMELIGEAATHIPNEIPGNSMAKHYCNAKSSGTRLPWS